MTRQRIEDLGRILELVGRLMEEPIFELWQQRPKDFVDWFDEQEDSRRDDIVHEMAYGIRGVGEKLGAIYEIASGQDYLNEQILDKTYD